LKFNLFKGVHFLKVLAVVLLILLTIAPVLYIFMGSIATTFKGNITIDYTSGMLLLFKSVLLNLGAMVLTILFGLLSAICVWVFLEKYAVKIALGILMLILLPPFIHTQSWIFFVDKLNSFLEQILGVALNFNGIFAVILTIAFSYLPITAGLCLIALLSIPSELSDMCRIDGGGKTAFLKIYLPFLYPALCIGGLLVFLLSINDYGIPSVFGINVFVLELYSRFSAGNSIYSVFLAGFPLFLLCATIMALFGFYISRSNFSFSTMKCINPFKKEKFIKTPAVFGLVILVFFAIVPLFNLTYEAVRVKGAIAVLANSVNEISYSAFISILAAVFSFIPALLFTYSFYKSKARILFLGVAALPFIISSPIAGLSLIKMWNTPLLSFVYRSPIMPAIALISRFAFVEAVILTVAISRLDKALIENMALHYPGLFRFFKCMAQLIWKECLAGILIVFALSMGEFGVTLLVTPPGYQTLTIKIYNYLHYGASEIVAVLCLFMLVVMLLILLLLFLLLKGEKNE